MHRFQSILAKASLVSLVVGLVAVVAPANAAAFTTASDTMTRLKISTTADHVIQFDLPSTITLDDSTNSDVLSFVFPSDFALGGTWAAADFTVKQDQSSTPTTKAVDSVANASTTPVCSGVSDDDKVAIAVDATTRTFRIMPCGTYTASDAAGTIQVTILGTAANGTLTNASSAGSKTIALAMCDETASCDSGFTSTHASSIAVGLVDDDSVSITASVDPSLTFDLDTDVTDGNTVAPYSVALGTLSTGTLTTSNQSSVNSIFVDLDTNASGGAVVTVLGSNTGLLSASTSHQITLGSSETSIAAGAEQIGLCDESVSATTGTLAKGTQYDSTAGACSLTNSGTQVVGKIETTATQIFNTSGAPIAGGRGEVLVKAAISSITPAASDYTNTLTFIATGTF